MRFPRIRGRGNVMELAKAGSAVANPYPGTPPVVQAGMAAAGMDMGSPFSPGRPLTPYAGYGGLARAWNMPTGYNIISRPQRDNRVSFDILRELTRKYDIARMCIGHRIDDVRSLGYAITAKRGYAGDADAVVARAEEILAYPEGPGGTLPFHAWIAKYLEDVLAYDAGTLLRRRDRAGRVIGLKVINGSTIAPVLDYWGDTPQGDAPAYVQFVNGTPWKWLTTSDLIYVPFRPQSDSPYGFAPLEAVLINANTDLRFQLHFLQWFTSGTVPEGFGTLPESISNPKQIKEYQDYYDALLYGDTEAKHQIRWVPAGTKFEWAKSGDFNGEFPLFLMRKTAAAFHITPNDLGWTENVNRATGDTQVDVQFRIGTLPLVEHVECILNRYLQQDRGLPVEFHFDTGQEKEDRLMEAQRWQICVDSAAASPDEMRRELLGLPTDPNRPTPRFYSTQRIGPVPLLSIEGVAGRTDPETYGPAKDQPALDQPFVPPIGVIPHPGTTDDQASLAATDAAQIAARRQLDSEGGPTRETPAQYQQRGAQQQAAIGPAAPAQAAAAPSAPLQQQAPVQAPALQQPDKPVAKGITLTGAEAAELATFRRFVKQRERFGEWRDFGFRTISAEVAAELNDGGRQAVLAKQMAAADDTARAVYEQLLQDFPAEAIGWVLRMRWTGPQDVPLEDVDFSDEATWQASHEPGKVDKTIRKIRAGKKVKPAVLIARPGHAAVMVADGHHRAKAAKRADVPLRAFVGHPAEDTGPWDELHSSQQIRKADDSGAQAPTAPAGPVAAGLAVRAADTGRVLMLQRAQVNDDPAGGTWEFPGGKLEDSEIPIEAAVREWGEETGLTLPPGGTLTSAWMSPNGVYAGYVYETPSEADLPIFGDRDDVANPDDPDGDLTQALAWWSPGQLDGNPAVRPELAADLGMVLRKIAPCGCCGGLGEHPVAGITTGLSSGATIGGSECDCCDGSGIADSDPGSCSCGPHDMAKADGSPKAQAPDPQPQGPDQSSAWPGWGPDLHAAEYWAPVIAAALLAGVDPDRLARNWLAHHATTPAADPDALRAEAERWTRSQGFDAAAGLTETIRGVHTDGYLIGSSAARAEQDGTPINLDGWTPGDRLAALQLLGERGDGSGLRELLNRADVVIKSIVDARMEELGRLLAAAAAAGDPPDVVADSIRDLLENPGRAHLIAVTELSRASDAASLAYYRSIGLTHKLWLTEEDIKVCPICDENAAAGLVPIDGPYPSGDMSAPAHPRCRCASAGRRAPEGG